MASLSLQPTIVFHLAFLTKDKIAGMPESEYIQANRTLSDTVLQHLGSIGTDRVFLASSGAAAFADKVDAAADVRLYGRLKLRDELAFGAWAGAEVGRRAVIGRIYSLAGPFINKHDTYALASFILDALRHHPIEVKARNRVVRSYVAVRELLSVAIMGLLAKPGDAVVQFDSGGEPMELGSLAQMVARILGGHVNRAALSDDAANIYVGDGGTYERLLAQYGISPVSLTDQITETASFLTPLAGRSVGHMIGGERKGATLPQAQLASHAGRSTNSR
jgi:nucleoside-diphosphate-sugar epimerase